MNTEHTNQFRAQFEAWASEHCCATGGISFKRFSDDCADTLYNDPSVETAWQAWQAATQQQAGPVAQKPVATVRVTHKGYGMELSTYVAYALPEGVHDLYATAQLVASEALEPHDPAVAAIQFALETDNGMHFLRLWNEGEFDLLRDTWPEAPDAIYIGADPLFIVAHKGGAE